MNARHLVSALESRGIRLSAEGDHVVCDAPANTLLQGDLDALRSHKAEILHLLRAGPPLDAGLYMVPAGMPAPDPEEHEYEPGEDWMLDVEMASADEPPPLECRLPDLVYADGERPAWCVRCGVELVDPRVKDRLCGPCRGSTRRQAKDGER